MGSSCFYFRISWILMERRWFNFLCPHCFLQGLRSLKKWLLQNLNMKIEKIFEKFFNFLKFFFQKVLWFEIWLHLDICSSSFLFQKCHLEFKNVKFEKKIIPKNLEKNQLFSKSLLRGEGGGTFRLHFWNLQNIWW